MFALHLQPTAAHSPWRQREGTLICLRRLVLWVPSLYDVGGTPREILDDGLMCLRFPMNTRPKITIFTRNTSGADAEDRPSWEGTSGSFPIIK